MIKDLPLKSKFEYLSPVFSNILQDIRRDIRNEHMKQDREFVQKYFSRSYIESSSSEIEKAYYHEIVAQGNEVLADWIVSKWILRHAEVYEFFVSELSKINENFEEIEMIDGNVAKSIVARSVELHGLEDTFIFSLLNSVALADEMMEFLKNEVIKSKAVSDGACAQEKPADVNFLLYSISRKF
jgi:hypothetical protein